MDRKLRDIMEQELVGASPPSARDLVAGAVLRGTRMRRRRRLSVGGSAAAVILAAASAVAMLHLPTAGRTDAPATAATSPLAATSPIDSTKSARIDGKIYLIWEQVSECHGPASLLRTWSKSVSVALTAPSTDQQRDAVAAAMQASALVQTSRTEEGPDIPPRYRRFPGIGPGGGPLEVDVRFVLTLKDPATVEPLEDELKKVGDVSQIMYGSCAEPTGAVGK